jgi:glycine cleavage system aminomethyltransferase T
LLGLDGPYAWEILAELMGPEAIGLPYMTYFEADGRTCFRTGKTGEYGYYVLMDRDECDAVEKKLESLVPTLDIVPVGLEALDQCALENWFFNIRREGQFDANPLELQLQWRVSYRKEYVGSAALAECRASGPRTRLTCLLAPDEIRSGDRVMAHRAIASSGGREGEIGSIVNAGFSQPMEGWVGLALIDTPFAYSGINQFVALSGDREVSLLTTSPPVLNNRSLYVSPQIHNYATRHEHEFPPIAVKGLP